jgi:hypothetical protein
MAASAGGPPLPQVTSNCLPHVRWQWQARPTAAFLGADGDLILVFTIGTAKLPTLIRRWLESWPDVPTDGDPSLLAVHETPSGVSSLSNPIWSSVAEAAARVNLQLMRYRSETDA